MTLKHEWKALLLLLGAMLVLCCLPIEDARFKNAVFESLASARWYAREHVLLCLVPAFFIAVGVYLSLTYIFEVAR